TNIACKRRMRSRSPTWGRRRVVELSLSLRRTRPAGVPISLGGNNVSIRLHEQNLTRSKYCETDDGLDACRSRGPHGSCSYVVNLSLVNRLAPRSDRARRCCRNSISERQCRQRAIAGRLYLGDLREVVWLRACRGGALPRRKCQRDDK